MIWFVFTFLFLVVFILILTYTLLNLSNYQDNHLPINQERRYEFVRMERSR